MKPGHAGTWRVLSSPDLDKDYLEMEGKPFVRIGSRRKAVDGEFRIGLLTGNLDGWYEGELLRFTLEGMDEMDPVHGAGTAELEGDRLVFVLRFHGGDEFRFECKRTERQRSSRAKGNARKQGVDRRRSPSGR
jgi:hypothetical protein